MLSSNENSNINFNFDLLSSNPEWSSIPEIVQQTFLLLNNKLTEQSNSIAEMQKQLNTKASQSELKSSLQIKANNTDVIQSLNDLHSIIDTLPSNDLLQILLDKKASKDITDSLSTSIDKLNKELDLKANKDFVIHSLHTKENKANANEHKQMINSLYQSMIEVKNAQTQMNEALNSINSELREKVDNIDSDLDNLIDNIKQQFIAFNASLNDINQSKLTISELDTYMKHNQRRIKEDSDDNMTNKITQFKRELEDNINKHKETHEDIINKMQSELNEKIGIVQKEVKEMSNTMNNELKVAMNAIKEDVTQLTKEVNDKALINNNNKHEEDNKNKNTELESKINLSYSKLIEEINTLTNELQRKVSYSDLNQLLSNKVDIDTFNMAIDNKASLFDIERYTSNNNHYLVKSENNGIDIKDMDNYNKSLSELSYSIKDLKDSIIMKANIKEVYDLLKEKPNAKDINIALTDMHNELSTKVSFDDYNNSMKRQAEINTVFCKENCLGKWLWTSNELRNSNIKWNIQILNLSPKQFNLEKDTGIILLRNKGIFQLHLGLLNTTSNALIQININGNPLMSYNNKDKQGVAMQVNEVISLEEDKSRITVSLSGSINPNSICFLIIKSII